MKKRTRIVLLAVFVSALFVSAQQNPFKGRFRPSAKPKIDFSVEPASAPVDKLDVEEFQLQRKDLQGKVIELEFDRVSALKQTANGYTAKVTFEDPRGGAGVMLLIPKEGLELFEDYSKDARYRRRETVLVEVLPANAVRAVGTRYSKNKPEGERYSW
ncbi:MAG: hypothetical protein ISR84_02995 [Kiritimatiellales bacterium]|nr:hypothetical protein [Kiritimatiellales bacterium]